MSRGLEAERKLWINFSRVHKGRINLFQRDSRDRFQKQRTSCDIEKWGRFVPSGYKLLNFMQHGAWTKIALATELFRKETGIINVTRGKLICRCNRPPLRVPYCVPNFKSACNCKSLVTLSQNSESFDGLLLTKARWVQRPFCRAWHWFQVFLRLALVTCSPRLALCECFPALITYAWCLIVATWFH